MTFEAFVAQEIRTALFIASRDRIFGTPQMRIIKIMTCVDGVECTAKVDEPAGEGGMLNQRYKIKITKEAL